MPSRKEVAPGQEGEQEAGVCLRSEFNSLERSLHLGHGTWRVGSQYKRRSLVFPERLARKEGGSVWLVIPLDVKKMESLVGETPGRGRL